MKFDKLVRKFTGKAKDKRYWKRRTKLRDPLAVSGFILLDYYINQNYSVSIKIEIKVNGTE